MPVYGGKLNDLELKDLKSKADRLLVEITYQFIEWYNKKIEKMSKQYGLKVNYRIDSFNSFQSEYRGYEKSLFEKSFNSIQGKINDVHKQIDPLTEEIQVDSKQAEERIDGLFEKTDGFLGKFATGPNSDSITNAAVNSHTNTIINNVREEASKHTFTPDEIDEMIRQRNERAIDEPEEIKL